MPLPPLRRNATHPGAAHGRSKHPVFELGTQKPHPPFWLRASRPDHERWHFLFWLRFFAAAWHFAWDLAPRSCPREAVECRGLGLAVAFASRAGMTQIAAATVPWCVSDLPLRNGIAIEDLGKRTGSLQRRRHPPRANAETCAAARAVG
jgi:hypothetical protein